MSAFPRIQIYDGEMQYKAVCTKKITLPLLSQNSILSQQLDPLIPDPNTLRRIIILTNTRFLPILQQTVHPCHRHQIWMLFQIRITFLQIFRLWKYQSQNISADLLSFFLRLHGMKRHVAAVQSAAVHIAIDAAAQKILQHSRLIHFLLSPHLRIARLLPVKDQILFSDPKQRYAKSFRTNLAAQIHDPIPVDLLPIRLRIHRDIAHLPNPKSTMQKMLKGMTDQIKQMIRRRQRQNLLPIDHLSHPILKNILKIPIPIPENLGLWRKKRLMQFNIDRTAVFDIGHFIGFCQILLGIHQLHPQFQHLFMTSVKLLHRNQHILVRRQAIIRHRIQMSADDPLYHQRCQSCCPQFLPKRKKLCRSFRLQYHLISHAFFEHSPHRSVDGLHRRTVAHHIIDHRQNIVQTRLIHQSEPVFTRDLHIPLYFFFFQCRS